MVTALLKQSENLPSSRSKLILRTKSDFGASVFDTAVWDLVSEEAVTSEATFDRLLLAARRGQDLRGSAWLAFKLEMQVNAN